MISHGGLCPRAYYSSSHRVETPCPRVNGKTNGQKQKSHSEIFHDYHFLLPIFFFGGKIHIKYSISTIFKCTV